MAEEITTPKTQTPQPAPLLPEPDLDALLAATPQFAELFGEGKKESGRTEPTKEPVQDAVEEPEPQVDLPEALPVEEEPEVPEQESTEEEVREPDAVQKRIDQLTARSKTAEEKAAKLEAELTELQAKFKAPPPAAPTPANPLASIETIDELQKRYELAQTAKDWAIQNLDGGEVDLGEGKSTLMDGQQVKALYARADKMLTKWIPHQVQFLQAKADFDRQAQKSYPQLFKAGSNEQAEYHEWLRLAPEVRKFPDVALIVGDAMAGRAMRMSKTKAGQKNSNGQTPPLAKSTPAASPRVPKSRALSGAELTAIASDPHGNTLDRFVSQLIDDAAAQRSQQR
jgi:hypothetical protein